MSSRYARPSSPRGRYANPARSSTGTFADPYYDPAYYTRAPSPRIAGDRSPKYQSTYYVPSSSSGTGTGTGTSTHSSSSRHDSYSSRPRRNTNDHARPNATSLTSLPIRSSYVPHAQYERSDKSRDTRGDTYITQAPKHKKVYSVDDSSRKTQLVADIEPARHRDSVDRGYTTSGRSNYHPSSKSVPRASDLGDDGYSYTDAAGMYRDTEPAWRRPRSGSLERGHRPTSMIVDNPARSSAHNLYPPSSTRGVEKLEKGSSRGHGRLSPDGRPREVSKYDSYPDPAPTRSSTSQHYAPAVHQDRREPRRDTYHEEYDRRDNRVENKRLSGDRFEDPHVTSRGFGIAPGSPTLAQEQHVVDRQPIWDAKDKGRPRHDDRSDAYYSANHAPGSVQMPEPRQSLDRDIGSQHDKYNEYPRERHGSRQESKGYSSAALGAGAAGAAALGTAAYVSTHDKEKGRDGDRELSGEPDQKRDRERRREYDDRDRSDRYEDRRDRGPEERRDDERRTRDRRYEDDDRERAPRKAPSSQGSDDERPRHYVDRDTERKSNPAARAADLDPDEEYRRRIQEEAERHRSTRDRDHGDSDPEEERRRRKDERERARGSENGPSETSTRPSEDSSRVNERSLSITDANMVQEPESFDGAMVPVSKSVQIVEPSRESPPPVKGILRKPTEKFPEDPEPIREGVAPHKDALKGKDIPVGARWTRIDRRLVNPQALEEAKERFEERMDCVIVLRVLTKQEIQKLADRTKKIRESRDDEDNYDREKRSSRSTREDRGYEDRDRDQDRDRDRDQDRERDRDRDRDRRRRYNDEDSDYGDRDRDRKYERERERDRDRD